MKYEGSNLIQYLFNNKMKFLYDCEIRVFAQFHFITDTFCVVMYLSNILMNEYLCCYTSI